MIQSGNVVSGRVKVLENFVWIWSLVYLLSNVSGEPKFADQMSKEGEEDEEIPSDTIEDDSSLFYIIIL